MKPIALYLTDTHLKDDNKDLVIDIFRQAVNYCVKNNIKNIFHAGDFFTTRSSQSLQVLIAFYDDILQLISDNNLVLYGIAGNHDKTNQDSEKSYLDIFRHRKCVKIIRDNELFNFGKLAVGFLPFFTDSYLDRLDELTLKAKENDNDYNILITHQTFNGAINNDGTTVSEAISPKKVKFWDKVLVGHYHDSNLIGNIHYTGSAYQSNFGERLDDKGFHLIFENGKMEFIESNYPKYLKVSVDLDSDLDSELELYKDSLSENKVRFIFKGEKTDIHKVDQKKLSDLGIDIKFELNSVNEEILKIQDGDFSSMSKKNIMQYFKEYCKIQDIPKDKMSKGLKILISNEY